jgi:hypothetical protein
MKSGSDAGGKKKITLSTRDQDILKFVARYRLATPDALYQEFFTGLHKDAMKSTLRRLTGKAPDYLYLKPQRIHENRVIYLLTKAGAEIVGASRSYCRAVRQRALFERVIVLRYFTDDGSKNRKWLAPNALRNPPFNSTFPPKGKRVFNEGPQGDSHLGYLVIDTLRRVGGLCQKVAELLRSMVAKPALKDYFFRRRFHLVVLTVTPERKQRLIHCIRKHLDRVMKGPFPWPKCDGHDRWPVKVEFVPRMLAYLPDRKGPKASNNGEPKPVHPTGSGKHKRQGRTP